MVIGGKDMYRGGIDIYNSVYGEDLGGAIGNCCAKESPDRQGETAISIRVAHLRHLVQTFTEVDIQNVSKGIPNGVCSGMELGAIKDYSPTFFGVNSPDLIVLIIKEHSWSVTIIDIVNTDKMRNFFAIVIFHIRVRYLGFVP
jgi:hypothetical protein